MGMDYIYAGSSSYNRFNKEWRTLGKYLGATPLDKPLNTDPPYHFQDRQIYFTFDADTTIPHIVQLWLNNPYHYLTPLQTKKIFKYIAQMMHEKIIPHKFMIPYEGDGWQILNELINLTRNNQGWSIK